MSESSANEGSREACIVCGLILTEVFKCSKCEASLHSKCANIIKKEDGKQSELCDHCYNEDGCKF